MSRQFKNAFWSAVDPVLLKVRSRFEHLELSHPSESFSRDFSNRAVFNDTVKFFPGANVMNSGNRLDLQIGDYCGVMGQLMIMKQGGKLKLGHHCSVGLGTRIWAQSQVEIGNYVLIAHLVDIHDSNSHSLDVEVRRQDPIMVFEKELPMDLSKVSTKSVRIEDDVWIGFKSSIMKGVTIGRGAVVAAGSVVTRDVPPYCVVAGNPGEIIRRLADAD